MKTKRSILILGGTAAAAAFAFALRPPIHFVMERKMMLAIKARAERMSHPAVSRCAAASAA